MAYFPVEIIQKKRDGQTLSKEEIQFFIQGFLKKEIPDYQISSWLMAVYLKGMQADEAAHLADVMLHSGEVLDFSHLSEKKVDKHSTGGVGDKTSMILAPIVAAAGLRVPMIAGRGLGHTGGTLDKLESIPGFSTQLNLDQFRQAIETLGTAIIGQTGEICPADRKLYALRDVTSTVESIPLICASIMSKKIAEGIDSLVLDVKYGSGAFMKDFAMAKELATSLIEVGKRHGKKVAALLTNMNQPLGAYAGNSLEMQECIAILKNETFDDHSSQDFADTRELTLELASYMIFLGDKASSAEEGYKKAEELLLNGQAHEKFCEMCKNQGGDLSQLPTPQFSQTIKAEEEGYVSEMHTKDIGMAGISLGAGRMTQEDVIDPTAGIRFHKKIGDSVKPGDPLFTLYRSGKNDFAEAVNRLSGSIKISLQKPPVEALIRERLL